LRCISPRASWHFDSACPSFCFASDRTKFWDAVRRVCSSFALVCSIAWTQAFAFSKRPFAVAIAASAPRNALSAAVFESVADFVEFSYSFWSSCLRAASTASPAGTSAACAAARSSEVTLSVTSPAEDE